MSKKQTQTAAAVATLAAVVETPAAADARVSQWSRELARAHGSTGETKAARRFVNLAQYLASVAKPGETVRVTFGQANEGAGLARGERGNPAQSWRLALQRTRQLFAGELPLGIVAKVDGETHIAVTMPKA